MASSGFSARTTCRARAGALRLRNMALAWLRALPHRAKAVKKTTEKQ